jgi:7-cyano-7-deazaguanine synthase
MRRPRTKHKSYNALVLLSGGLDSSTLLYAIRKKYRVLALIVSYGQRHGKEVAAARRIAQAAQVDYRTITVPFPAVGSSLLDHKQKVPQRMVNRIPSTYVPARNTVFLSVAASFAEAYGINKIFIGVNAVDYSGYPDCRPVYITQFNRLLQLATKTGVEGLPIRIHTPLVHMTKSQIVVLGKKIGVPYELTWSCYQGGKRPCGKCDSCRLRARGFREARVRDPLTSKYEVRNAN